MSGRWLISRYYTEICLQGLRKTTKSLSQDSRSPGRDLNLRPPGVLTNRSQSSVRHLFQKTECFNGIFHIVYNFITRRSHFPEKKVPSKLQQRLYY
jgi:hypothetical protein